MGEMGLKVKPVLAGRPRKQAGQEVCEDLCEAKDPGMTLVLLSLVSYGGGSLKQTTAERDRFGLKEAEGEMFM